MLSFSDTSVWPDLAATIGESSGGATIEVVYVDGMKGELFNEGMTAEIWLFGVLSAIIYFIVLFHTGSFWITTCGLFQVRECKGDISEIEEAISLGGWDMRDWTQSVSLQSLVSLYHVSHSQFHTIPYTH